MSAIARPSSSASAVTNPIRVMIVDDSVVIRGLVGRWCDEDPQLAVVASHRNGRLAVEDVLRSNPDVVVLDIEMPDMDGLTALPLLLEKKRDLVVVVASTLTRRNAEISLKALSLGAADYVPKPENNAGVTTSTDFRRELVEKVVNLGMRARSRTQGRPGTAVPVPNTPAVPAREPRRARPAVLQGPRRQLHGPQLRQRAPAHSLHRLLHGGPQALNALFGEIGSAIGQVPVVITQHMPPTFTAILAEHISKSAGRPAAEGKDGETLQPGRIYVAPGGKHMILAKHGADTVVKLTDGPPVNFCKPPWIRSSTASPTSSATPRSRSS